MKWIGLTGGIASGKSTVSRIIVNSGIPVIDADQLAREVVRPGSEGYEEVIQAFGLSAVSADGELDRKVIGEVVFRDKSKLAVLESIIHPRVRRLAEERRRELESKGYSIAIYDVPLLFEKKMKPLFDSVITVVCAPDIQLKRLMDRDKIEKEEALRKISAQLTMTEKAAQSDHVIENNSDLEALERSVKTLIKSLHHADT